MGYKWRDKMCDSPFRAAKKQWHPHKLCSPPPPLFPVLNEMLRLSNLQRVLNRDKIFWEILSSAPKVPFARGVWMHDPQEIFKSRGSKNAISGVLNTTICSCQKFLVIWSQVLWGFFITNFSVQGSRVRYSAFYFMLWELDGNITIWVKIEIFPVLIAYYWSEFGIFWAKSG